MQAQSGERKRATFGAHCRLRRGQDFDRLFQEAQSIAGRTMVLRALPTRADRSRCGVIASKRTFRRAVDRNRAKRCLREAFRLEREIFPIPCDVVLVARKRILDHTMDAIRKDFCTLVLQIQKSLTGEHRI